MEYGEKSEEKEHLCLECGDVIEYGRTDRKFCSRECKNRWHNKQVSQSRLVRLRVLAAIQKNYEILNDLLRLNITSLTLSELRQLGYNIEYFTSFQKVRRHDVYTCFDISFTVVSDNVTSIRKLSLNLRLLLEAEGKGKGRATADEED